MELEHLQPVADPNNPDYEPYFTLVNLSETDDFMVNFSNARALGLKYSDNLTDIPQAVQKGCKLRSKRARHRRRINYTLRMPGLRRKHLPFWAAGWPVSRFQGQYLRLH